MSGLGWRTAMSSALYGPGGFFVRADGPAEHFRTSVHASPLFAEALAGLLRTVDAALGHPHDFDIVDIGAGRGELLVALHAALDGSDLAGRLRMVAVERAARPDGLDPAIGWQSVLPESVTGALLATEWLDNVPLSIAQADDDGVLRRVLVDPAGNETLGGLIDAADRMWIARWWPPASQPGERLEREWRSGERVEIGWPRDAAWAEAAGRVRRGMALAVDYGHRKETRPRHGTLTGYRAGRQLPPAPDGSCDITAHVAMDAVAAAAGTAYTLMTQRTALRALGVDGGRPPLEQARTDPAGYLRALTRAGAAAELTDPEGLGGHWWLLHTAGISPPLSPS